MLRLIIFSLIISNTLQADILKGKTEFPLKEAIEFKPFEYLDPKTGKIVSGDTIIELTNELAESFSKRFIKARELYEEINQIEAKLNELGYSLRQDEELVESVLVDGKELVEQSQAITELFRDFDEKVMKLPKEMNEIKADFLDRQATLHEKEFTRLYEKALESLEPPAPIFKDLEKDPNILQVPNRNLSNFVYKQWKIEKGDPNSFFVSGKTELNLSGDFTELEGLFDTRVDIEIFSEIELNLIYAFLKAQALDSGKLKLASGLEIAGKKIDRYSFEKEDEFISWRLSDKESTDKLELSFREGESIAFAIGPIPCLLEVGGFGRIYLDSAANVSRRSVSASAIPGVEAAGFANLSAGVRVAKIGVEGQLVLINSEQDIQGGLEMKVPKATGKPELSAFVRGDQKLNALNGNLYLAAGLKLPLIGEKRFQRKLWDWQGIQTEGVLFDFTKMATDTGYTLRGAPQAVDIDEKDLDNKIKEFFDLVDKSLRSEKIKEVAADIAEIELEQAEILEFAREIAGEG